VLLHHVSLPKLDDAGVLEYDAQSGELRYRTDEGLVVMLSDPVARLEMLEGESPYRIDDWPVALRVDRNRDEVVAKDEEAVSE